MIAQNNCALQFGHYSIRFGRLVEIILGIFIGISGVGFLLLAVFMLNSALPGDVPIAGVIIIGSLALLFLTIGYRILRRSKILSDGVCYQCGSKTEIKDAYVIEQRIFGSSTRMYCPLCWSKQRIKKVRNNWIAGAFFGVAGAVLLYIAPEIAVGYILVNVFLFQAVEILSIIAHELAHAVAARKLGMRIFKICIGMGRPIFKVKLFNHEIEFCGIPIVSAVFAASPIKVNSNKNEILMTAAGPAMNAILVIIAAYMIEPSERWSLGIFLNRVAPLHCLLYCNLLILINNLWPRNLATPYGILGTDGKQLLKNLRLDPKEIDKRHAGYFVYAGLAHSEKKQYDEARASYEEGLALYPENFWLLNSLGILLIKRLEFGEARDCFIKARANAPDPPNEALMLNNIAYVDALIGDKELLDEADQYSQEAVSKLPWFPPVKGTRGTVLLQLGQIEDAIRWLNDSLRMHEDPDGKAQNCCFLAIAEHVKGNANQSEQYLNEARRLDPQCFLLPRVEKTFLIK